VRAETVYQGKLVSKLRDMFPGCTILQPDPQRLQGVCDLLILFGRQWAMLEVKKSSKAAHQPNQPYYVEHFNGMSFASFICPETEEQVLRDLQSALGSSRKARLSKSK
jgi:hypothetical protein